MLKDNHSLLGHAARIAAACLFVTLLAITGCENKSGRKVGTGLPDEKAGTGYQTNL